MMTRVFGAAITFLSFVAILVNTFLFLNSSAFLEYNTEKLSLAKAGVFYPYFIAGFTITLGIMLMRDRELEAHH